MTEVIVVIGAGQIGQAIARRVGVGRHILLADMRQDNAQAPPNERHWHGGTPTTAMTHVAIAEALDGKVVEWMEKVGDEQYLAESGIRE